MLTPSAEGTTVEPDRRPAPKMALDQQNRRCLADTSGLELTKLGNRPLGAVHRSSSRLFGPRTYPDKLPIWEIRACTSRAPSESAMLLKAANDNAPRARGRVVAGRVVAILSLCVAALIVAAPLWH